MKQWVLHGNNGIDSLSLEETSIPQPGENEVLIKLHAVSLNYRDLMIVNVSTVSIAPAFGTLMYSLIMSREYTTGNSPTRSSLSQTEQDKSLALAQKSNDSQQGNV